MGMDATTGSESTPSSAAESLAEMLLYELIELPANQRASALHAVCTRYPEHARTLRRRLALLEAQLSTGQEVAAEPTFGRFELVRRLGGGMAEVYLAIDPHLGSQVVVKILRHPELQDAQTQASFAREALAASRLQHPCIGTVLEIGAVDGTPYLLQPYIDGISLAEWIQKRAGRGQPLRLADLDLVLGWLEDILRALQAAHEFGLVHRDVKPANILIPFQGRPKLLDFGLCQEIRSTPDAATPTPVAGTLEYMAPELLSPRDRPVGPPADIYAVGVTLFECVTQRLPFVGDSRQELCRAILLQDPPDPRRIAGNLPRGLGRVLACALAKSAWERYPTAAAFADDLARLRAGMAVRPPRRRLLQRLRRWVKHHRTRALVLFLVALLLASVPLFEQLAEAHRGRDLDLLATSTRLLAAAARAEALVPGWPQQVPELERWIEQDGEALAALLPRLRQRSRDADADPDGDRAEAEALRAALVRLEYFAADPHGELAVVRERLQWARKVGDLTLVEPAAAWRETVAAVAADPHYRGLQLSPQVGLMPLGRDPESGLFEFYQPRSAWPGAPVVVRDPLTKRLVRSDGSGLVFVLIPPGRFLMGQQRVDPKAPRYDLEGGAYNQPHEVELGAFLLSKYEMTQGQWYQLTGERPSSYAVGQSYFGDPPITWQHPVESVGAARCDEVLRGVGLCLPTESQWEYACGTGAATRWFFGNDESQLTVYANTQDLHFAAHNAGVKDNVDADDGYAGVQAVGQRRANPFGLHDVLGNVSEWCCDYWYSYSEREPRPGDGLRQGPVSTHSRRVYRGGSYRENPHNHGRTSNRMNEVTERQADYLGLRPALPLQEGR